MTHYTNLTSDEQNKYLERTVKLADYEHCLIIAVKNMDAEISIKGNLAVLGGAVVGLAESNDLFRSIIHTAEEILQSGAREANNSLLTNIGDLE